MTPTQLESIKKELQDILDGVYLHGILNERRQKQETIELESGEVTIQQAKEFIESKLVEIQMTKGLQDFGVCMEEINKYEEKIKKLQKQIKDLKSNKLGGKDGK